MSRLRVSLYISLVLLLLLFCAHSRSQMIQMESRLRASHFLSIHYSISAELADRSEAVPTDLPRLLGEATSPGVVPRLLRHFPDGLTLAPLGDHGFTLEEPEERHVTLFRKDRLVSTDTDHPHWKRSGKPATK